MSMTNHELNRRIQMAQAYWREIGLKKACEQAADPEGLRNTYQDPFSVIDQNSRNAVPETGQKMQTIKKIFEDMLADERFPAKLKNKGNILHTMSRILTDGEVYPPQLTILNRTKYHNAFMDAQEMTRDLDGLKRWLEEFYCKRYLKSGYNKGKLNKANQILETMSQIPEKVATKQEYLNHVVLDGAPSLAQLIGGNRVSIRSSKTPWGLQMIMDTFGYQKQKSDTSAKGANLSKPMVIPDAEVNHYTGDFDISRF